MHNKHFEFKTSHFLRNWVIVIHALALLIILVLPITFIAKLVFSLLMVFCYFYSTYNEKCLIREIKHHQHQDWFLYDEQGEKQLATLSSNHFISNFLLILFFNNKQRLVLLRHQLKDNDWRCLQSLLRR